MDLKRLQDKRFLLDMLRFVSVLAVAAILLNVLTSVRPDMSIIQREVAKHTSFTLALMGVPSDVYEWSISVPDANPEQSEIVQRLQVLGFSAKRYVEGIVLTVAHLQPDNERIASEYTGELIRQGLPVYVSPATVSLKGDVKFDVAIIPECVGWIGMFAVIALIIAYPHATWRKRLIGIAIAIPLMYAVNILRLATSMYAAYAGGASAFEFTHDILWKTTLVIWALCLWMAWIYFVVEEKDVRSLFSKKRRKVLKGR